MFPSGLGGKPFDSSRTGSELVSKLGSTWSKVPTVSANSRFDVSVLKNSHAIFLLELIRAGRGGKIRICMPPMSINGGIFCRSSRGDSH